MLHDKSGNVAIMFALSLIPLMLAIGMAVDVTKVLSTRMQLQDALDAATLAALAEYTPDDKRAQVAEATFNASLSPELLAASPKLNITFTGSGNTRSAVASFTAAAPLAFAGILGTPTMDVSGQTTAGIEVGGSMDISLWLDASASMGVAATEKDRDSLQKIAGCAFACHMGSKPTSMDKAHSAGVKLRIDLMKQNVQMLMDKVREVQLEEQVVRYSVAGMSRNFEPRLAMTDDFTKAKNAVANFTLSGVVHNNSNSASRLTPSLSEGRATLPAQNGDGTKDRPRQFVVIVSDGMQFDWNRISSGPIGNTPCEEIKARGISVAVIQLRYVELKGNSAFETYVRPHFTKLGPALQACASPGMFYSADSPEEIQAAFAALAVRIRGALRLMN
ncbi:MAG: TadE/TadG family type IV pilus assembly protein [Alphaproteobacteria bacterium]